MNWLDIIPPLSRDEFDALKQDIRDHGVKVSLVYDQHDQLVDGRHRRKVCDELGVPEEKVPKDHRRFANDEERLEYVLAANVKRRHLSLEQKKEIAAKLRHPVMGNPLMGKSQERVARLMGVDQRTIDRWEGKEPDEITSNRQMPNACSPPDLRISVPDHERVRIHDRVKSGDTQTQVGADYKISQQRISQIVRQVDARSKIPDPVDTPPFPKNSYRCIVIDPSWPVEKIEREERPDQGKHLDYPVMSLEQIGDLPIPDLAYDGCHVYLWTTLKFLPNALEIFGVWGVKYQCPLIWHKKGGITPFSWQYNAEIALFGRIGSLDLLQNGIKLCFTGKRNRHSEKPDEFYDIVRRASPEPRLNMYARKERKGFEAWGSEVNAV